jgi:hypothetical protein
MRDLVAVLVLAVPALWLVSLFSYALASGWRRRRQDRRKIMAESTTAQAVVTNIGDSSRNGQSTVYFSFQPTTAGRNVHGMQRTTRAAIDVLGIAIGSSVEVRCLAKWPQWAFVGGTRRTWWKRNSTSRTTRILRA